MTDNDIFKSLRQMAKEKMAKIPTAPTAPDSDEAAASGADRFEELLKAGQPPQAESDSADADADRLP